MALDCAVCVPSALLRVLASTLALKLSTGLSERRSKMRVVCREGLQASSSERQDSSPQGWLVGHRNSEQAQLMGVLPVTAGEHSLEALTRAHGALLALRSGNTNQASVLTAGDR